jgi:predicted nucleic acid-binding protein
LNVVVDASVVVAALLDAGDDGRWAEEILSSGSLFAPELAERIWELRPNLRCYDAWYVALAEALDLPLATLDKRLAGAAGPKWRFLTSS